MDDPSGLALKSLSHPAHSPRPLHPKARTYHCGLDPSAASHPSTQPVSFRDKRKRFKAHIKSLGNLLERLCLTAPSSQTSTSFAPPSPRRGSGAMTPALASELQWPSSRGGELGQAFRVPQPSGLTAKFVGGYNPYRLKVHPAAGNAVTGEEFGRSLPCSVWAAVGQMEAEDFAHHRKRCEDLTFLRAAVREGRLGKQSSASR
eukprot:RCo023449